jgi:hypothetical protein
MSADRAPLLCAAWRCGVKGFLVVDESLGRSKQELEAEMVGGAPPMTRADSTMPVLVVAMTGRAKASASPCPPAATENSLVVVLNTR